jgi:hypothetical protein
MADKKIEILRETTEGFPANVYYVRGDKLVAYYPEGNKDAFKIYDTPMSFSKRYRTFETIAKVNCL